MKIIRSDVARYWLKFPTLSALILLTCAMVFALVTNNSLILRSAFWLTPSGTRLSHPFLTLGQASQSGAFGAAPLADIRKLDNNGYSERYTYYGPTTVNLTIGGSLLPDLPGAFVADNFFSLLGIRMERGSGPSGDAHGVVLSHQFWKEHQAALGVGLGASIVIDGQKLPIVGILRPDFVGLGDQVPSVWISASEAPRFMKFSLPMEGLDKASIKRGLSEQLPMYFALLATTGKGEAEKVARDWAVRHDAEIVIATASGPLTLGFDARGVLPALRSGINVAPRKLGVIRRYITIISVLSAAIFLLTALNLASFFAARSTERISEIKIRAAVGARRRDLLLLFTKEIFSFVTAAAFLGIALSIIELKILGRIGPFASFLSARRVFITIYDLLPGIIILTVIGCIGVLSNWPAVGTSGISRGGIGARKPARRLALVRSTIQWTVILLLTAGGTATAFVVAKLHDANWGLQGDALVVQSNGVTQNAKLLGYLGVGMSNVPFMQTAPMQRLQIGDNIYLPNLNSSGQKIYAYFNEASPAAFRALGMYPIIGRFFSKLSQSEVVVSKSFVTRHKLSDHQVIGLRVVRINPLDPGHDRSYTVVGVVPNVHYDGVRSEPEEVIYTNRPSPLIGDAIILQPSKSRLTRAIMASERANDVESLRALKRATVLSGEVRRDTASELVLAALAASYAGIALLIVMVGVFSEIKTVLIQRTREFALRASMGSTLNRLLFEFMGASLIGMAASIALALIALRVLAEVGLSDFISELTGRWHWVMFMSSIVIVTFMVVLLLVVAKRMRRVDLSFLLRVER